MRRLLFAPVLGLLVACSSSAPPAAVVTSTPSAADVSATIDARVRALLTSGPSPAASPVQVAASASAAPVGGPSPAANATAKPVEIEKVVFLAGSGRVTAAALVKNPNADLYLSNTIATATAYDSGGQVLGTNGLNVISLAAGEERWFGISSFPAPGAVAKVDLRFDRAPSLKPAASDPAPKLTVVQSTLQLDHGIARQVGQIKNEGTKPVSTVIVDVIYFNATGGLLGVGVGAIQNLAAGETASFSATTSSVSEQPADTKTYPSAQLTRL